eukprot:g7659.t1
MLVGPDAIWGTIGGGQFEFMAIDNARALLRGAGRPAMDIPLGPEIGQCCGGRTKLAFSIATPPIIDDLELRLKRERDRDPAVFVFGAGHVGLALTRALDPLPFAVTVIETRAEALEGLPDGATRQLTAMPEACVDAIPAGGSVVILTHDHALDFLIAQRALARSDLRYVGMIGSATKRATFSNWLKRNGGDEDRLAGLILPIGGDLVRDKRPAVIAALVAAELLQAYDKEGLSMKLSRRFPLNALRVFEAVARLKNFTRAAEDLGMTQTAVSYQIKLLEEYLGERVFIRRPRALQLTECGQSLLPKVAEAFLLLSDAVQLARGTADETLEIHSTPTFASHWLARHLGDFQLQHPNIAVRLVRHSGGNSMEPPPTDVAIRIGARPWEDLVCHPLLRLTYTPMLTATLAAKIGGVREPADLVKLPWISNGKGFWQDWCEAAGLGKVDIRQMQLDASGALDLEANAAIAGHGVAMLSPFLFSAEIASGRLIQPFDICLGDAKTYWLCYPPGHRNRPKIKAFASWLQASLTREIATTPESSSMKLSKQLPLNALRVFESAARQMSFTKAGEELGLTQTAVSYQIKLLEDTLGQQLFLRRPRQVTLTATGARLAPRIGEAFGMIDEALSGATDQAESMLIIHTTATFASRWLAHHLGTFQLQNPGIAVRLETSQEMVDFSRTEADVAIRSGSGHWPGLKADFLMKSDFTPMLSPALAATIGGIREPADILKLRIIDPADVWWRIWFNAAGLPEADLQGRPISRFGAQAFEAAAAIAGQGVAILKPEFYADDVALGRLIQPFELRATDGSDYWLAYPESRRHSAKIRAFREFMRRAMPTFRDQPADG